MITVRKNKTLMKKALRNARKKGRFGKRNGQVNLWNCTNLFLLLWYLVIKTRAHVQMIHNHVQLSKGYRHTKLDQFVRAVV